MLVDTTNWYPAVLTAILDHGHDAAPRGHRVKEALGLALRIDDALANVIVNPIRKLNYRYLVAEWLWIAFGRAELRLLTPYNSQLARFSDDGETLAGAYGPRLAPQWDYVLRTLRADPDSRQAVATIWTPNPGPTKDVPCTVSLQFLIRHGRLVTVASMRSSDAWLGLPYDVFTFAQLGNALAGMLGVPPGPLLMHLASSHLYEPHWDLARQAADVETAYVSSPVLPGMPPLPLRAALAGSESDLIRQFTSPVWHRYVHALRAAKWGEALHHLAVDELPRQEAA